MEKRTDEKVTGRSDICNDSDPHAYDPDAMAFRQIKSEEGQEFQRRVKDLFNKIDSEV